ncbi:hypothetical protein DL768_003682 [Monosporascus sp. mg162]|nr:hypothetical protein DL768_003682 [Monosporascus sp. mg162]
MLGSAEVDAFRYEPTKGLRRSLDPVLSFTTWHRQGSNGPEEGSNPEDNRIQIIGSSSGVKFPCKDLAGILPSYTELKQEHFPLSKLSTAEISPVGVVPESSQPVMAAQTNFIEGGLLLTMVIHHSAGDAVALDAIIDAWAQNTAATASGSNAFTTYDSQANNRSALMKGTPGARLADFPEYILHPTPKPAARNENIPQMPFQLPPMVSHIFYFSPGTLADLKATAAAFSTNDALCAFIWRNMTLARDFSGGSTDLDGGESSSAFTFSVNVRSRTCPPLPPTYLGNASMACMTDRLTVSTLTGGDGFPRAADVIRKSLSGFKSPSRVPLTIGLLGSRSDPTDFKLAHNAFLGPDIIATSWADVKAYSRDWGALGTPDAFRVPGEGADGVITILPRLKDGGLEVLVGLEAAAMERLLQNDSFTEAAKLWG